jgi:hypothetical protein
VLGSFDSSRHWSLSVLVSADIALFAFCPFLSACNADRLVLGSSGSSRHWSRSALVSACRSRPFLEHDRLTRRQLPLRVRSSHAPTASVVPPVVSTASIVRSVVSHALVSAVCACCTIFAVCAWCTIFAVCAWCTILDVCACCTTQSPGGSSVGLAPHWSLPQCRSFPLACELHWNSAALVSSTLVVI